MRLLHAAVFAAVTVLVSARGGVSDGPHFAATVIVMRHCVRAPGTRLWDAGSEYSQYPSDYTQRTLPAFPVAADLCTPRGLDIVKATGEALAPTLSQGSPIAIVADNVQRDIDTAAALAAGLGVANASVTTVDGAVFNPVQYGVCDALPDSTVQAALQEALRTVKPPAQRAEWTAALQQALGAPNAKYGVELADMKTSVENTQFGPAVTGRSYVASWFAELFMLQYGAGLDFAFGKLTADELFASLGLVTYQHQVSMPAPVSRQAGSNLLAHLMAALDARNGTTIFAGHDTDLVALGAMLGLTWAPPAGYPTNATLPGSYLRFDMDANDMVLMQYVAPLLNTTSGASVRAPANLRGSENYVSQGVLSQMVKAAVNPACVST